MTTKPETGKRHETFNLIAQQKTQKLIGKLSEHCGKLQNSKIAHDQVLYVYMHVCSEN